ncbi:MAG: DUF805 domain-containing protein [Pseudomonadota bacterium]
MSLLFGMTGKIGRGQFWLGLFVLVLVGIVMSLLVAGLSLTLGRVGQWISFGILLLLLYPAVALSRKRLRDRGRNNLNVWLIAYLAPGMISNFAQTAGIGFVNETFGGLTVSSPTTLGTVLLASGFLAFVVAIIDLGFLRGNEMPGGDTL